jgi:hypothetical protein
MIRIFNKESQIFVEENNQIIKDIKKLELILNIKTGVSRLYLTFVNEKQRVCPMEEIQMITLEYKNWSISKVDRAIAIRYAHKPMGLIQELTFTKEFEKDTPILDLKIALQF